MRTFKYAERFVTAEAPTNTQAAQPPHGLPGEAGCPARPALRSAPSPAACSPARPKRSSGAPRPLRTAAAAEQGRPGRRSLQEPPVTPKAPPRKESRSRSPVTYPRASSASKMSHSIFRPGSSSLMPPQRLPPRCARFKSAPPQPAPAAAFRGAAGPRCNLRQIRQVGPPRHAASSAFAIEPLRAGNLERRFFPDCLNNKQFVTYWGTSASCAVWQQGACTE